MRPPYQYFGIIFALGGQILKRAPDLHDCILSQKYLHRPYYKLIKLEEGDDCWLNEYPSQFQNMTIFRKKGDYMSWAEKKQCGGIYSAGMEKTSITVSYQDSYPAKKCFFTDFLHRISIDQRREFKGINLLK